MTTGLREHSHLRLLSEYLNSQIYRAQLPLLPVSPHVQPSLYLGGELRVVMYELVTGEVQGFQPREGGKEGGGKIIELVIGQAEIGQIGQDSIKWAAPPYYDRK